MQANNAIRHDPAGEGRFYKGARAMNDRPAALERLYFGLAARIDLPKRQ